MGEVSLGLTLVVLQRRNRRRFHHVRRQFARGRVVLHDCLPVSVHATKRERVSDFWVGDTWKVLDTLLEYRPDLRVHVVPTAPSGLVVVRGLDKASRVLEEHMPEILARYTSAEYDHTPAYWAEQYPLVRNDDAGLADALGS